MASLLRRLRRRLTWSVPRDGVKTSVVFGGFDSGANYRCVVEGPSGTVFHAEDFTIYYQGTPFTGLARIAKERLEGP